MKISTLERTNVPRIERHILRREAAAMDEGTIITPEKTLVHAK